MTGKGSIQHRQLIDICVLRCFIFYIYQQNNVYFNINSMTPENSELSISHSFRHLCAVFPRLDTNTEFKNSNIHVFLCHQHVYPG